MNAPSSLVRRLPFDASNSGSGSQHVVLIGFMGAGKSTIGRALAVRTGAQFADLDDVISEQAGKSIAEIFRDSGEVAFRARERSALREVLATATPLVIATGGGTFADPMMQEWIAQAARSVYLQASIETLIARIGSPQQRKRRPKLCGPDPRESIERLLGRRTPAYQRCDITVRTDDVSPDQVVEMIVDQLRLARRSVADRRLARRHQVNRARVSAGQEFAREETLGDVVVVKASRGDYSVHCRDEAGAWIAHEIGGVCPGQRLAVITDTTVGQHHGARLVEDLRALGKSVTLHSFAPGESSKSLAGAATLLGELLDIGLDKQDAIVALGGGVVCDLAGFVASTLLRGIAHVCVPTSTLAAVDASVGGKTAVNTVQGKNLVGTIHAPRAVLIAVEHLATQERRQHVSGLVEALKMAATLDAALFDALVHDAAKLTALDSEPVLLAIKRAVGLKAEVVSRDERDVGDRAVLNYGHTIGHAIEIAEDYRLLHGEAVALGMVAESDWSDSLGLSRQVQPHLSEAIEAFGLPTEWQRAQIDKQALSRDKKREGSKLRLPIVTEVGRHEIRTVELASVLEFVARRTG